MNYIVLDLEWNQGSGQEPEVKEMPFEVIDIGAVKLNEKRNIMDKYNQLVKPVVYHQMNRITSDLVHLHMEDLQKGRSFVEVMNEFLAWCGEDYVFCTWGPLDLFELQRNMHYFHMEPLSGKPVKFLDVQKLFSIAYEDKKSRRSLEYAIDFLQIEKDVPFHRAFSDAYYTARILEQMEEEVLENYSIDTYILPKTREEEVHVMFHDYMKYISREFPDKQKAIEDREVISTKCYLCRRNIRKKVRWFSTNGKHYYSISVCPVHGYMKSKIRIRKSENDKVYVVKTSKFITEEECQKIMKRKSKKPAI
ncbi:DNA polymerase III PolC-type [Lachnospiraceae bacterium]|jgi:inhibitor of KinA sporulation pathway (predicted exonuclease)|nr:exonuclease domain-containing protein [Lachnospiraceae bacterium]GFI17298.1 DNA polymerase III PolC-type [Lachnospiraceae bacterium]GFI68702.1 DNA polymerase III PolC-type [Lachnospiraceae bacterium]